MEVGIDVDEDLQWVLDKIAAPAKKKPAGPAAPVVHPVSTLPPLPNLGSKKQNETELLKRWKASGEDPKHLDPLLDSMKGLVESRARMYKNIVEVPTAALDHEFKQQLVEALRSYDPSKGAQLGTWVTKRLKKANRYILTHQNFARIPENVANGINKYTTAKTELTEKLGYEPDDHTLAEKSGLSMKEVKVLNKSLRKGLVASGGQQEMFETGFTTGRREEVLGLIHYELTPEERTVFEYTFGRNGKPQLKPGDIARKTGFDNSKVAKLRTSIFNKMKPHLHEDG